LQRRLSLGLHIPIAILAAQGLEQLFRSNGLKRIAMAATLPTSFLLVLRLISGAVSHDPHIFITQNEAAAFNWLQAHTAPNAIVLAAPETGAFIPAFAGQRVIYGHPYETVNADQQKQAVTDFYNGTIDRTTLLYADSIDYVFDGPRERALGSFDPATLNLKPAFTSGDVTLYSTH
jgi:hypothetical protein